MRDVFQRSANRKILKRLVKIARRVQIFQQTWAIRAISAYSLLYHVNVVTRAFGLMIGRFLFPLFLLVLLSYIRRSLRGVKSRNHADNENKSAVPTRQTHSREIPANYETHARTFVNKFKKITYVARPDNNEISVNASS